VVKKLWTREEDNFLKDCYAEPGNSIKFIATKLGRTELAVTSRAAYLCLNKTSFYMTNLLTPRETDVFELLLTDLTLEQVAKKLSIARCTVETHAKSIYAKNYVHSRKQLKEKHNESRINS
jgi:DNA-binding CsgD family transcriptional regulator